MPTTFDRVRAGLQHAKRRKSWGSLTELASDILERKVMAFRRSGDGSAKDDFLKISSIRSTLAWGRAFGLLAENDEGNVWLTDKGQSALESDDSFARQIRASIKSYLENHGLPLDAILKIIEGIALPEVPDGKTIGVKSEALQPAPDVGEDELRTLLFMLSCSGGLEREIRVFYGPK